MLRYDDTESISTELNPIEDVLNLIAVLKSKGFTSDLLKEVHGFSDGIEIRKTAKLISLHVDNAIGLANQGLEGPAQTSFLPLYYSTLNLAKVYLLFLGKRMELKSNRWHGAKYTESEMSKNFLNEKIKISNQGTLPLLYHSITNKSIGQSGLYITLDEIYKNITSIGAEYKTITKKESGLLVHSTEFIQDDKNGHYLKVNILNSFYKNHIPSPRLLKAYPGLNIVTSSQGDSWYETKKYFGNYEAFKTNLQQKTKRYLNSQFCISDSFGPRWISFTPINGRFHVLNEDLCIMLAYFHLSNVVRYNPEHLYRIMDSKYWAILLALRKHGFLRFEKLMWGNYIKKSFEIS
ncbi:YaaC family protein [Flagellimonas sp.]|uniref:YaaC family protein n=1 Tax=Flagellimonas sp. TaxID=2058762 RepID=UPI003AB33D0A